MDKTYGETNNYIPVSLANNSNLYEPTFVDTSYIEVISDIPSENEHEITKIIENNSYLNSSLNESNFIDSDITINMRLRLKNLDRIIIGHLNINSIRYKINGLKLMIKDNIDILVISETKIDR